MAKHKQGQTAPMIMINSPAAGASELTSFTATGVATAGASVTGTLTPSSGTNNSPQTANGGSWSISFSGVAAGTYTLQVCITGKAVCDSHAGITVS
jgi:hypothetical protein